MQPTDPSQLVPMILALFHSHSWLALAVVVMGFVTRLLKSDTKLPVNIPARWQPVIVVVLGQVYAVLQATAGGLTWKLAVEQGVYASFITLGLFDLVAHLTVDEKKSADAPPAGKS